jgi:hypothetical protein
VTDAQGVADALAASGVSPEAITIELTETVFANDPDHLLAVLLELQALGVQLAIDDFGTGFSSLSYLQRLPITTLKIDKVFIDAIRPGQDQVPVIAGTVIDLARPRVSALSRRASSGQSRQPGSIGGGARLGRAITSRNPLPPTSSAHVCVPMVAPGRSGHRPCRPR